MSNGKKGFDLMNDVEIYYFSGTGNSLIVAKDLAEDLNAKLIPVIPFKEKQSIHSEAEIIGIVFPIYDFQPPFLINEFIEKLKIPDSTYLFAVCTYGVMPLKAMKKFNTTCQMYQKTLSSAFTVKMPHNGVGYSKIPKEKQEKMFNNWKKKRRFIIKKVKTKETGPIETNNSVYLFALTGIFLKMMPKLLGMMKEIAFHGWDSLGFVVNDQCNGCGICEKICPVNNIHMEKSIPIWSDKCINCFACLQWCPKQAINAGKITENTERYHHPDINVNEIINQKQN